MNSRLARIALCCALAFGVLALGGCGLIFGQSNKPVMLGEADNGSSIQVKPQAYLVVELESNPSTGYAWQVVSPGPLRQDGEPEYVAPKQDPNNPTVGGAGTQRFNFVADESGSGQLRLEYRRSWETTAPAEKTWTVSISVN